VFYYGRIDPNAPRSGMNRRDGTHVLSAETGDAGRDGYTCLAKADRQTGVRPVVGGEYDPNRRTVLD
jgi:hypothetical protein